MRAIARMLVSTIGVVPKPPKTPRGKVMRRSPSEIDGRLQSSTRYRIGLRTLPVSIVERSGLRESVHGRPVDGVLIAEPDSYDMAGAVIDL